MNFDVAVRGRPWKIAVESTADTGHFAVVVKGKRRVIDVSWIDADTLSLIDGNLSYEVRLQRSDAGILVARVGRREFDVIVTARKGSRPSGPAADVAAAQGTERAVKTPMPGRVVKVLVSAGDRVTAEQGVVVVEAMKMENELRSPVNGVVKQVNVRDGMAVESGAVLVVVE